MKKTRQKIEQAIIDFKKEYNNKPHIDFMGDGEWNNLAWKLDENNIAVNFVEVNNSDDGYVIATYYSPKLKYNIVLDWNVSFRFESETDLIDEIERLENLGLFIEKSLTVKN